MFSYFQNLWVSIWESSWNNFIWHKWLKFSRVLACSPLHFSSLYRCLRHDCCCLLGHPVLGTGLSCSYTRLQFGCWVGGVEEELWENIQPSRSHGHPKQCLCRARSLLLGVHGYNRDHRCYPYLRYQCNRRWAQGGHCLSHWVSRVACFRVLIFLSTTSMHMQQPFPVVG